jgi:hypothetical protein
MTNIVKYKGTKTDGIDLSSATLTNVMKLSTTSGASATAFTNDTVGTTPEDGFIKIDVGGTTYKIPFWADD